MQSCLAVGDRWSRDAPRKFTGVARMPIVQGSIRLPAIHAIIRLSINLRFFGSQVVADDAIARFLSGQSRKSFKSRIFEPWHRKNDYLIISWMSAPARPKLFGPPVTGMLEGWGLENLSCATILSGSFLRHTSPSTCLCQMFYTLSCFIIIIGLSLFFG